MGRVSRATKGELVAATGDRYRIPVERSKILDEFVAVTGFHRKHAIRLLRPRIDDAAAVQRRIHRRYARRSSWRDAADPVKLRRLLACTNIGREHAGDGSSRVWELWARARRVWEVPVGLGGELRWAVDRIAASRPSY
jgi:hypothetical protein